MTNTQQKPGTKFSRYQKIELQARRVLRKSGVYEPPVPVQQIAQDLGIHVRYQPMKGDSDVSAVLKRDEGVAIIGVNSSHAPHRQRFSIAHELGHYFLHSDDELFIDFASMIQGKRSHYRNSLSSQAKNREEMDANAFAAALLMPRSMVERKLDEYLEEQPQATSDNVVAELAAVFHVSREAMNFRLLNLGLLVRLG